MSWIEVKNQLKNISDRDMLALLQELYKLDAKNKRFLDTRFLVTKRADIIQEIKDKISRYIYRHTKLKECRILINNYKKSTGDLMGYIELCLWHAACIVEFLLTFGGCGEDMENAGIVSYESACKSYLELDAVSQEKVFQIFIEVIEAAKPTGSHLKDMYEDCFKEYLKK